MTQWSNVIPSLFYARIINGLLKCSSVRARRSSTQSGSTAICRNRTNSVECLPRDQSYQVFFVHDFSVPLPILILQTNFFLISIAIK